MLWKYTKINMSFMRCRWSSLRQTCLGGNEGKQLLDLRVLRDLWTQDGAREVFARLVTHCVAHQYPGAQTIRPNPGDDGIDVIVGQLRRKSKIWQSKFFADGLGKSQQAQIRNSFEACIASNNISNMTSWTLCIPIEMSIEEKKWWDGWKQRTQKKYPKVTIDVWTQIDFERFQANRDLTPLFDHALQRGRDKCSLADLLEILGSDRIRIEGLPDRDHYRESLFVKKLQAANIEPHRAARVAFFNFELIREQVERGGSSEERQVLVELQEKIYALWEEEFHRNSVSVKTSCT